MQWHQFQDEEMKFIMYSTKDALDASRPGVIYKDKIVDIRLFLEYLGISSTINTLRDFIELNREAIARFKENVNLSEALAFPAVLKFSDVVFRAPLADARKLILLAGNYIEHIREVGYRIPPSAERITPQFFMKPPSTTIIGPEMPVILSRNSIWVDWEAELAVVISQDGKNIPEEDAMDYVFGYTILNDISERKFNTTIKDRFQREKDPLFDWLHGKWFDGFAPMGPCITSKEDLPDPNKLKISLFHNGVLQQDGCTADMIHTIPYLIHKLSQIMTVESGDVIATGTPSGVGISKGIQLREGDELVCRIDVIGELRNPIEAE
jgi:2-keto-4-pentenoate hydratase/2-oxohepta-3-ene-1,7-dioic acid hydratase in catechol pathway